MVEVSYVCKIYNETAVRLEKDAGGQFVLPVLYILYGDIVAPDSVNNNFACYGFHKYDMVREHCKYAIFCFNWMGRGGIGI